jgi:hypothetical protein
MSQTEVLLAYQAYLSHNIHSADVRGRYDDDERRVVCQIPERIQ